MKRKEKKKIIDIDKKTLNIIGISLSLIIILIVTVYYLFQMNREYNNGDKRLPFTIEKNTIITVLDGQRKTIENDNQNEMLEIGIIDDIYLDLKLNDEKNKKIKSITLDKFDITNEFEDTKKIKIVPISENLTEKKEDNEIKKQKKQYQDMKVVDLKMKVNNLKLGYTWNQIKTMPKKKLIEILIKNNQEE